MNELAFIWGPPLSGQRRWMAKAAEETDPDRQVSLVPLLEYREQVALAPLLERLTSCLNRPLADGKRSRHVYFELPWSVVEEGFILEDWIAENPTFANLGQSSDWNLSFVGLCPADADRLPDHYRRGLEEFSRASSSAIIVLSHEDEDSVPRWLGGDLLDFGPRIEVFDEGLWPAGADDPRPHVFSNVERLILSPHVDLPIQNESARELFRQISHGDFGSIWGAEALWRSSAWQASAITFTLGGVFEWSSTHPDLLAICPEDGARLSVAGFPVLESQLRNRLSRFSS